MQHITLKTAQIKDLSIFEGRINRFKFEESTLELNVQYVLIPRGIINYEIDYDSEITIIYKEVSYLNLALTGAIDFTLKQGVLSNTKETLEYSGGWGGWSQNIQTSFELSLVCNGVELILPDHIA